MKQYELIKDGRKLKPLINNGFIKKAKYEFYPYIDCNFTIFLKGFNYKDNKYIIKYHDGNFYPLVYKEIN